MLVGVPACLGTIVLLKWEEVEHLQQNLPAHSPPGVGGILRKLPEAERGWS